MMRISWVLAVAALAACGGSQKKATEADLDSELELMEGVLDQTIDLAIRVTTDTNLLAGVTANVDGGEAGTITLDLTFDDWNGDLTITAPPADEVQGG